MVTTAELTSLVTTNSTAANAIPMLVTAAREFIFYDLISFKVVFESEEIHNKGFIKISII